MVNPGGTGRPRLAISARFAPLPPSRSRISALPSALPSPKVNTHLPAGTAAVADLPAADFAAGFGAGLATGLTWLFFSALRAAAGGAAFFRLGADAFDFAAVFFVFATALAMTYKQSAERGRDGRLTPFWTVPRKAPCSVQSLQMEPAQQSKTDQAVEDQKDRDDQIEQ